MEIEQLPPPSRAEKIDQFKKQIRAFTALQYVMPALMLLAAYFIPRGMTMVDPGTKNMIVFLLCVFAAADFGLIRFMLLPSLKKRLAEAQNGIE